MSGNGQGDLLPAVPADKPPALPWERQKGETFKAFEAFAIYRDLGPSRTIPRAAEQLGKSHYTLDEWSMKWKWVNRAKAWDDEIDRRFREEAVRRRIDLSREHGAVARALIGRSVRRVHPPSDDNPDGIPASELDAMATARWLELGWKMQRHAAGDPDNNIGAPSLDAARTMRALAHDIIEIALTYIPPADHAAFIDHIKNYGDRRAKI